MPRFVHCSASSLCHNLLVSIMSVFPFLDLPIELAERILSAMDVPTVLRVMQVRLKISPLITSVDTHPYISRLPVSCTLLFVVPRKSSTRFSFIITAMWMLLERSPLHTQTDARNWTTSGTSGPSLNPQRTGGYTYIQISIFWKAECL